MNVTSAKLRSELQFSTSRSGGPGGQHVNKVETRVTVKWNVHQSSIISAEEKELLLHRLKSRLTTDGALILTARESRSQSTNKELVLAKLDELLTAAFRKRKIRKHTRATATARRKRVESKKIHGEKKRWRRRPAG